jgi:tetratricopeptide (TPR) repeat protein
MQNWSRFLTTAFVVGAVALSGHGQAPQATAANPNKAPDYSKEAFVVESLRSTASFEDDGTGTRETTARVKVQSQAGVQQWGLLTLGYSSANEQVEVGYARVQKADGRLIETTAADVQDMTSDVTRIAPMYSDYREKHVTVKGLGVGDVLEYQFRTRVQTPLVPGHFWLGYDFFKAGIALDEELEVRVPKDRDVKVKSPDLKPATIEDGNHRVYTWKSANRERKEDEEPPREFPPPAVLISTFKSWEEVGQWWGGLERERVSPTPEIRAKAAELTKDAKTDEEKLRAIYNYVATKFRYVSISFGIGRYQPHAASEVLQNEYGDCKDKHTLLASLLGAAGIEAYPALVNSARKIDPDVPSPGQFDHVVTVVREKARSNKLIWLDTTTEIAPFGLLTFNLRDKQALVILTGMPALLVTTPADPPFKSFRSFEIDGKLSDAGVLEGKVQRSFRGDTELLMRAAFRQVPQSQWKDLVQGISQASGFAGDVSQVEADTPENTGEPYRFSYNYTRKDYPDWANHRITPPLGFLGFPELKDDKKRTQPIPLGAPEEITAVAKVELPKGYAPRLLQGVDLTRDFAEYHSSYSFKDGVFEAAVRIIIKRREVPLSAVDDYKSFQKAVSDDFNRYTDLGNGSESAPLPSASSNPEANSLVQQAREAFQQHDLAGAADSLERAVKLDGHYKDAWLMLGGLRMMQNDANGGAAAFRKAIESDPKDPRSYQALASVYTVRRRPEEAIPVWRDLLKEDPNNRDAHSSLGSILVSLKRYSEAVPELEAASNLGKPNSQLELTLGEAYLRTGRRDKATAVAEKAADGTLLPVVWNNAAYFLADNNLDLPPAQRYAEKAVKSIEDETTPVTLDKLQLRDLDRMTVLASYWDTLGWVYFRQGNLEKSRKYLDAAWNLEQSVTLGDHLGQVYEKLGKKQAAIDVYALTAAVPGMVLPGLPDDPRAKIRARLERMIGNKATTDATVGLASRDLSQMRRTKLGRLSAKNGSAEFWVVMVAGGKVEDAKFISGAEHLRPFGKTVASIQFKAPLPDDAPTKLVRRGVLVCVQSVGCDFTLFTVDSVHSID